MTLGCPSSIYPSEQCITRRVSSTALSFGDEECHDKFGDTTAQSLNAHLSRQVSNDGLVSISDSENDKEDCGASDFDKSIVSRRSCGEAHKFGRPLSISISLHDPKFLDVHTRALRLEADLQPMRLILSRIMAHPTLNRKGIFNSPVDPVALGLPDYYDVIKKPMDLGLVKVKLHAIVYLSRREVADDIRLVFSNAMKYNPPHNAVHLAAKDLLSFFEDQVQAFTPELMFSMDTSNFSLRSSEDECSPAISKTPGNEILSAGISPVPCPHVHSQATRNRTTVELLEPANLLRKRKKRGSKINPGHACDRCEGRSCLICNQGCLPLEPTLLTCNGANCAGARIRKSALYFVTADGSRHFCQRCHASLPAVLPVTGHDDVVRYKRDLLKRKNDEEIVERWLSCSQCDGAVHQVCAMHDEFVHSEEDYRCPDCVVESDSTDTDAFIQPFGSDGDLYTFMSGSDLPVKVSDVFGTGKRTPFSADALPETEVSSFIERRIRERMLCDKYPNAERTVLVRIISDCNRSFKVPEVVRCHFRMATQDKTLNKSVTPPLAVNYRSKAIALFQKIDGLDVCIFCMYVHEYDGDDHFESNSNESRADQKKRVYVAYLDSVEHFRPRTCRTAVYHEMLVAYLASARKRGFETAHIWSCPPSRGNCFVFWNHPGSQRTPNPERLEAWYHAALSRAVDSGVVTEIQSLYDTDFKQHSESESTLLREGFAQCPPLLDGDFWIDEAVRLHGVSMARYLKAKVEESEASSANASFSGSMERCPARQVAALLRDILIPHPSSLPFRRPVNAAAMKLTDYHKIITNPMDLGTAYSRCMLGEYSTLADLVADVELVFVNAKTYNPKGHIVYIKADEVRDMFYTELNRLVRSWVGAPDEAAVNWESVSDTSMSLDLVFGKPFDGNQGSSSLNAQLQFDETFVCTGSGDKESFSGVQQNDCEFQPTILIGGGAEAVHQRMVGDDTWLLEKNTAPSKGSLLGKRGNHRRRKSIGESEEEPPAKRRRQSWLGIEVGASVRRLRTSFFTCSLVPKSNRLADEKRALELYESYTLDFNASLRTNDFCVSTIADVRHSLLEFSQFRNLEFDTLRHAKYSTAVLLYHFHNRGAAGVVPLCSSCNKETKEVRWHKLCKVVDLRRRRSPNAPGAVPVKPEELCGDCYHGKCKHDDQFIPLQVSVSSTSFLANF